MKFDNNPEPIAIVGMGKSLNRTDQRQHLTVQQHVSYPEKSHRRLSSGIC